MMDYYWKLTEAEKHRLVLDLVDWLIEEEGNSAVMKGLLELGYPVEMLYDFFYEETVNDKLEWLKKIEDKMVD